MTLVGVDTSVAVPLLVAAHEDHRAAVSVARERDMRLCGHALPETYSVLTRLPPRLRVAPADAARLIRERFGPPLLLGEDRTQQLPDLLAEAGVAGGAVYDALVALAAVEHDVPLASLDLRARRLYEAFGVAVFAVA